MSINYYPRTVPFTLTIYTRKIIDRVVLKTIGYSDDEIEEILPELYRAMATELRSWKELKHRSSAKEKESTPQLHLFAKE